MLKGLSERAMTATKTVLVDLSGTLHIGNQITPGAVEALEKLKKENGIRVRFVTNTTKESRAVLHSRLTNLGFKIEQEEIVSSLWAARNLIQAQGLKPYYLVSNEAIDDFQGLTEFDPSEIDSVVVGLAPDKFERESLNSAMRILLKGGRLVAIHEAKYYATEEGLLALGPGPFVKMLEYATGVRATVVGKPSPDFFKAALDTASDDMNNVFMIGDDVKQDVEGAQKMGIRSYLVRTGKYKEGDESKISPPPYRTVDTFASAVQHILTSSA